MCILHSFGQTILVLQLAVTTVILAEKMLLDKKHTIGKGFQERNGRGRNMTKSLLEIDSSAH